MLRTLLGLAALATLLATYTFNPTVAWITLFSVATLTLARYVRQRDEEADKSHDSADW